MSEPIPPADLPLPDRASPRASARRRAPARRGGGEALAILLVLAPILHFAIRPPES